MKKVIYNVQNDNDEEETIIVPESVKEIADDAFKLDYTSNVISIHLPKTVEKFSTEAFCTYRLDFPKLTSIEVDPENPCYQSIDGVLYNKTGRALIRCPHGRTSLHIPKSVTSIGEYAFLNCTALTEIVFPSRLKTIGYAVFKCCRSLQNLIIPENVTSIGAEAFCECRALIEVKLPSRLETIGESAFSCCKSLVKVVIPENVTSIGANAYIDYSFPFKKKWEDDHYIVQEPDGQFYLESPVKSAE